MKIVAFVLIVLGVVGLAYGGITYTKKEKVLDIGPIEATAERHRAVRHVLAEALAGRPAPGPCD